MNNKWLTIEKIANAIDLEYLEYFRKELKERLQSDINELEYQLNSIEKSKDTITMISGTQAEKLLISLENHIKLHLDKTKQFLQYLEHEKIFSTIIKLAQQE